MKLTMVEPLVDGKNKTTSMYFDPQGRTMAELIGQAHCRNFARVCINDEWYTDERWQDRALSQDDSIFLYPRVGLFGGEAVLFGLTAGQIASIVSVAATLISLAVSLAQRPPTPATAKKSQPAFAVAGITNTVAPGTPKFFVHGKVRTHGHLIAASVALTKEHPKAPGYFSRMEFKVQYFMGKGPIESLTEPLINDTPLEDYENMSYDVRLGGPGQTVQEGFEQVHQVYSDGRPINRGEDESTAGDPIVYTTKSRSVNRVTFFLSFPNGIVRIGTSSVNPGKGTILIKIEAKRTSEPEASFAEISGSPFVFTEKVQDPVLTKLEYEVPEPGKWDFRLRMVSHSVTLASGDPVLFNVMETQFLTTAYPGNAVASVSGIGSNQIDSLENLKVSFLEEGLNNVEVGTSLTPGYTNSRPWTVRHLLVNSGIPFPASLIDNDSLSEAAAYYAEQVPGFNGDEARDECDVIVNERKPAWDWVRLLADEGRAILTPGGSKLRYAIDKQDAAPGILFVNPGNMAEVVTERGFKDRPINTIKADFPDASEDYKIAPAKLTIPDLAEPERTESLEFVSIVRKSEISRELRIRLNRARLRNKRWGWKSPLGAMGKDPFDHAWIAYTTVDKKRGYTGLVAAPGFTTLLFVDEQVELEEGFTYEVLLRHRDDALETRIVANPPEKYLQINPTAPFVAAPVPDDIWFIGKQNVHKQHAVLQAVNPLPGLAGFDIKAVLEDDAIWVQDDPLPDPTLLDATADPRAPRPLLYAEVTEPSSGTWEFRVVPGFDPLAGLAQGGSTDTIILAAAEPPVDGVFDGAIVTVNGEAQTITDHDGDTDTVTVVPDWVTIPGPGDPYTITWQSQAQFGGFKVEKSDDPAGPWEDVGESNTSSLTLTGQEAGFGGYFRIRPKSVSGELQNTGLWVIQITAGDTTAPTAPNSTEITSDDKTVFVTVTVPLPFERDYKAIEVKLTETTPGGTVILQEEHPVVRDDTKTGTAEVVFARILSEAYGTIVCATARAVDYAGNPSAWVDAPTCTTLVETIFSGDADTTIVSVNNTTDETNLYNKDLPGEVLGKTGTVVLDLNVTMTDSVATLAVRTATFRAYYGTTLLATIVCNTADATARIGANVPYRLTLTLSGAGDEESQEAQFQKVGTEQPAQDLRLVAGTASESSDIANKIRVTVQLSVADFQLEAEKTLARVTIP